MKYEDLKILDELREKGSITEEEYQREKAKLLNEESKVFDTTSRKPLFGMAENTYLMLMHLSQLAGLFVPLVGFLAPIFMWITNKDTNANVDLHGKNILNFSISFVIYSAVLAITIIGIPLLPVLLAIYVILVVIATLRANKGEYWKYPLSIQFFK